MDKKVVDAAMAAIQETYGYGQPGSHPKKCEICGKYFEEPNDISILILRGPSRCPDCKEILELRDLLADH
jgi:predicted Zn-ribbon and HTH transcriptional regulator